MNLYTIKSAYTFLGKKMQTEKEREAFNVLVEFFNKYTETIDDRYTDIMLLRLFLAKYIKFVDPLMAIKETMKDIEGDVNYNLQFAKYDIAHQIQFNQGTDDVESFLPLVDEVLEQMKQQLEWK